MFETKSSLFYFLMNTSGSPLAKCASSTPTNTCGSRDICTSVSPISTYEQRVAWSTHLSLLPSRFADAVNKIELAWRVFTETQWELYQKEDLRSQQEIFAINSSLNRMMRSSTRSELMDERAEIERYRLFVHACYVAHVEHAHHVYTLGRVHTQTEYMGVALMITALLSLNDVSARDVSLNDLSNPST